MPESLKDELEREFLSLYPSESERLKSKTYVVREMYDQIEDARRNGVKLNLLVQVIQNKGINISYQEFRNILHQIRKEKGLANKKTKPSGSQGIAENKSQTGYVNGATSVVTKAATTVSNSKSDKEPYDHVKNLPVNEKYAHVYRFRKVNGSIKYFIGTPAEEYYSLGGDPDDGFEKMNPRKQRLAVTRQFNKVNRQKYIYHNHIE